MDMHPLHQLNAQFATVIQMTTKQIRKQSKALRAALVYTRRRGTALVETPAGILLVSEDGERFSLPGGAANRNEMRIQAAIRELREETGLRAVSVQYLFCHMGGVRQRGAFLNRNHHKVFLIEAEGEPTPMQEIKAICFYQPGDSRRLSKSTRKILKRYLTLKSQEERRQSSSEAPPQ
jgi:ADP-ribose pyrophosphatase YjhB (NUDIX family)